MDTSNTPEPRPGRPRGRRRRARRRATPATPPEPAERRSPDAPAESSGGSGRGEQGAKRRGPRRSRRRRGRRGQSAPAPRQSGGEFPYVALTVHATGIHPATARVVALDAIPFAADGSTGEPFRRLVNPGPGSDIGPRHEHGLSPEDVASEPGFGKVLKALDRLIDGRTLVVHDAARSWGFIVSEAKRAMAKAARANRRGPKGGRRQKVGHVPKPGAIVDTLATARRRELVLPDNRLATVARAAGLDAEPADATIERARLSEHDVTRGETELLAALGARFVSGEDEGLPVSSHRPGELRADEFGLQRESFRVEAHAAPGGAPNPGRYEPGRELVPGMEVVLAPETRLPPEEIIPPLTAAGLNFREKVSRETSLVVCNVTTHSELTGKSLHAHRKGIPLMSDVAFLEALSRMP
ncbi:DNA polymerase III subunit epsilon [Corynebacterium otitidis]